MQHPRNIGAPGVWAFLTIVATERKFSAFTHNQAFSAILFLYREVLEIDLSWLNNINRPNHKRRIHSVLNKEEVASVLAHIDGPTALLAQLLFGTGMRLMESMRLRIKDVDFDRHVIIVREAKGGKDRVVMLPRSLVSALRAQLLAARIQWEADRQIGRRSVAVWSLHMRWNKSIPALATHGLGFGGSHHLRFQLIHAAGQKDGIICTKIASSGR